MRPSASGPLARGLARFARSPLRRFRQVALCGATVLAVAGCEELGGLEGLGLPAPVQTGVTVSRNEVTIVGPRGFCVYPSATRDRDGRSFVLLGNCAAIFRSPDAAQPNIHAVLTATVQETDTVRVATQGRALADLLRSETGRGMLSRSGDPDTVKVLDSFQRGDVLFVHASDSSAGYAPEMTPAYWRAFFDLNGRIVSVAVLGFEADPIASDVGQRTVRDFADLIRRNNPVPPS